MTVIIEFDEVTEDTNIELPDDPVVIVTGGKGEKGDPGDPGESGGVTSEDVEAAVAEEATERIAADTAEVAARNTAIAAATSALINGAPGLLDTLGEIADALADDDDALAALTEAINARALQTALDAEATTRATADTALSDDLADKADLTALTAEVTRATNAENALDTRLDTAESDINAAETAIAAEATARNAADLLYAQQAENNAEVVANGYYEISENHLASEVTARTTGDATNAAAIAAETTRATTAEGNLYEGEINRAADALALRVAAEATLQTNINTEVTRATAAELVLASRTDPLDVGEMVGGDRKSAIAVNNAGILVSGRLHLYYFNAEKTESINQVEVYSGATAAGATPTLVRVGIYQVNTTTGDGTLVAAIANDTALYASTFSTYIRSFTSPFAKVRGTRYAVGTLCITGATAPIVLTQQTGSATLSDTLLGRAPRVAGRIDSQTDLPASFLGSAVLTSRLLAGTRLIP